MIDETIIICGQMYERHCFVEDISRDGDIIQKLREKGYAVKLVPNPTLGGYEVYKRKKQ